MCDNRFSATTEADRLMCERVWKAQPTWASFDILAALAVVSLMALT